MVLGLCGEVGELANLIKKIERGDLSWEDPAVRWQVVSELADVYTYTLITSVLAGIDLEKAYERKRVENEQRWGKPASDSGTRDGDKRPLRSVDGGKRTDGS
jgi:NTP pyrophosphatase (non-canonical NTP hydrolase)